MDKVLLFDIDNTLTPPRTPVTREMVECLSRLTTPFHLVAGSNMEMLVNQFFSPMNSYGYRGNFKAFTNNGSMEYSCNYTDLLHIYKLKEFSIMKHLEEDFGLLVDGLRGFLREVSTLPKALRGRNVITNRTSMLNVCPSGRRLVETKESFEKRAAFVAFDKATNYRDEALVYFKRLFKDMIDNKGLLITKGGQTSFDICIKGEDKAKAVKELADDNTRVVFVGDALFDNGNDAVVKEYIDNNDVNAEYHQVESYKETMELIKEM